MEKEFKKTRTSLTDKEKTQQKHTHKKEAKQQQSIKIIRHLIYQMICRLHNYMRQDQIACT